MSKELKKMIFCFCLMIFAIFAFQTISMAAGFSISPSSKNLKVGETMSLTVTVSDCEGKFSFSSSDSNVVSVSDNEEWVGDSGNSYSVTLTAKKAGTATITVTATDVSDKSFNEVTGSKKATITVSEPEQPKPQENNNNNQGGNTNTNPNSNNNNNTNTKSSDNSLKSITVGTKNYSKPSKDITVPSVSANTTSIEIKAETNDSKAKVSGTGTKELVTGTNKFTLTVTAENGKTQNYIIRITRLAEENNKPNIVDDKPIIPQTTEEPQEVTVENLRLSSLKIEGVELIPEFSSETFEYSIFITDEEEIKVDAVANLEGANIEIIGNTGLVDGENTVIVRLTKDEQVTEYKITVNKTGIVLNNQEENNTPEKKDNKGIIGWISDNWKKYGPMLILSTITLVLLGTSITFAVISYRYSSKLTNVGRHERANSISREDLIGNGKT